MKNIFRNLLTATFSMAVVLGGHAVLAQTPRLVGTERQVRAALTRIETSTDIFRTDMQAATATAGGNNREERITDMIDNFERSTAAMRATFDQQGVVSGEITDMLDKGARIDKFMTRRNITGRAATRWGGIKTDLDLMARYYSVTWNSNQNDPNTPVQTPVYSATDDQMRTLMAQIQSKMDVFKSEMSRSWRGAGNVGNSGNTESISTSISQFELATNQLRQRFASGQSTMAHATEVINRARTIDQYMTSSRTSRTAQNQWVSIRTDLGTLATYYHTGSDWDTPVTPGGTTGTTTGGTIDARMTGTFKLNTGRSDDLAAAIDRAIGTVAVDQRDRTRRSLERRLASPDVIAIERNGRTVSMGSSNSRQVTFQADGVAKTETNQRGRTVTTTATANNEGITINYEGDRMNDFYVSFAPQRNDQLNVTRRIYLEDRNQTVTVASVYDKVNTIAEWPAVTPVQPIGGTTGGSTTGEGYIPSGTRLTGRLTSTINTRTAQVGDRFAMEVTSPGQYRGAIIEGSLTTVERSTRPNLRSKATLDLDTLKMSGKSYTLAGVIDSVTAANGTAVTVIKATDTGTTTQPAAPSNNIGGLLGSIFGAITTGSSTTATGAGTVLVAGRDILDIGPGSTLDITVTSSGTGPVR